MKILKKGIGYKRLLSDVKRDTKAQGCFNEKGCDHEFTRMVPADPSMHKFGMTMACKCLTKCMHKYCDKFAWVMSRVQHYAEKTGVNPNDILNAWESRRDYWYMNYYQDSKQPLIEDDNIRVFDTSDDARKSIGTAGFRCPHCGKVSKDAQVCTNPPCDWKAYGLFGTMGKGVKVFCKDTMVIHNIFMPVAWEKLEAKKP